MIVKPAKLPSEIFHESLPFSAHATSAGLNWEDVFLTYFKNLGAGDVKGPSLMDYRVTVNFPFLLKYEPDVYAKLRWGDELFAGNLRPGHLSILGRDIPAHCEWEAGAETIHVSISHELMESAAIFAGTSTSDLEVISRVSMMSDDLHRLLVLLALEVNSGGFYGRLYSEVIAQTIAALLLRNHSNKAQEIDRTNRILPSVKLSKTLEYLHANYAQNIGLSDMAKISGISKFYFSRMFRNATGYSPHQFLIALRIRKAQDHLIKKDACTLSEAALRVGFYDQAHFSRHFKSVVGVSPLKWFRQIRRR